MRVIDSSVLVDALVTNAQRARTLRGLLDDGTPLSAPHGVDLEVTNTIRRLLRTVGWTWPRPSVPLLTADARLANAPGLRCDVELVT